MFQPMVISIQNRADGSPHLPGPPALKRSIYLVTTVK